MLCWCLSVKIVFVHLHVHKWFKLWHNFKRFNAFFKDALYWWENIVCIASVFKHTQVEGIFGDTVAVGLKFGCKINQCAMPCTGKY